MKNLISILKVLVFIVCIVPAICGIIDLGFLIMELCNKGSVLSFINSWPYIFYAPKHPITWPLFIFLSTCISTNLLNTVQKSRNSIVGFITFLFGIFFITTMVNKELAESIFMGLRWWGAPLVIFGIPFFNSFCSAVSGQPMEDYQDYPEEYNYPEPNYQYQEPVYQQCQPEYNQSYTQNNDRKYEEWRRYQDQLKYEQEMKHRESERQNQEMKYRMQQKQEEDRKREQERQARRNTIAFVESTGSMVNVYGMERNLLFSRPGFQGFPCGNAVTIDSYTNSNKTKVRHTVYDNRGHIIKSF